MMVFVPLAFGLSPDLVFPLNVENDESVGPTAGAWVVAIFERRFCGVLLVDGADKSDELVSGLVGAARSAEECGPGTRWTAGPCSRDPHPAGLTGLRKATAALNLLPGSSGLSSSLGASFSGTVNFCKFNFVEEIDFSGGLKGNLGESAMLLCGAGRVRLTATEVSGAETVLYVTRDDLLESALDRRDGFDKEGAVEDGAAIANFGLSLMVT